RASTPVPVATAYASIRVIISAVEADTTRRVFGAAAAWNRPSEPTVPWTRRGSTHTPPLAMVAYTDAICSGVTASPWPKAIVARLTPDHDSTGGRMPADSPGYPRPVVRPNPNRVRYR